MPYSNSVFEMIMMMMTKMATRTRIIIIIIIIMNAIYIDSYHPLFKELNVLPLRAY